MHKWRIRAIHNAVHHKRGCRGEAFSQCITGQRLDSLIQWLSCALETWIYPLVCVAYWVWILSNQNFMCWLNRSSTSSVNVKSGQSVTNSWWCSVLPIACIVFRPGLFENGHKAITSLKKKKKFRQWAYTDSYGSHHVLWVQQNPQDVHELHGTAKVCKEKFVWTYMRVVLFRIWLGYSVKQDTTISTGDDIHNQVCCSSR